MADKMDNGGISWCDANRDAILNRLVANAVKSCKFHIGPLVKAPMRKRASQWLDLAIEQSRR